MGPHPDPAPPATPGGAAPFPAVVAEWLNARAQAARHEPVAEVIRVSGDGSDWEGDTEGGFYSRFGVEIAWVDQTGAQRYTDVTGGDMESLWEHVVSRWPA